MKKLFSILSVANKVSVFVLGAVLLLSGTANATTVTFSTTGAAISAGDFIDSDGYRFTNLQPRSGAGFVAVFSDNTLFNANDAATQMTAVNGSSFDLLSFEFSRRLGDGANSRSAEKIEVIGNFASGGSVSFFTNNLLNGLLTATLPSSFIGLSSVIFSPIQNNNGGSNNYEFLLDNIEARTTVSAVPLPAGLPLYAAGLAVIGFVGWRRKRKDPVSA